MIEASTIIFITILVAVAWVIFVAWWDEEHKGKKKNLQPPTKKYEKNSEI
jgi:FtsZ-interacting cell division protein ZipA